jgi:hypothetical protein
MRNGLLAALLLPALAPGLPPGAPMSDFGPSQVALGLYFDHSGQDFFEDYSPAMLNTTGLSLDYAPWSMLSLGLFAGAAELDVDVPDDRVDDTAAKGFNTGFSFHGGASARLATPRFASGTTRLVAFGTGGWFDAEDDQENRKRGLMTNAGLTVQYLALGKLNLVMGGEFQFLLFGEQTSSIRKEPERFGLSVPALEPQHYVRGLVGVEWFFQGRNKPFVSLAFRPTGSTGWHEHLGLRDGSVSITLGAIATLPGKGKNQIQEDEPGLAED